MDFFRGLIFLFSLVPLVHLGAQTPHAEIRDRLNKIFYWQIADELKLSPTVEKELALLIEDFQRRREGALKDRDEAMQNLKTVAKNKATAPLAEAALNRYQRSLASLTALDPEEYAKLKALLGPEALLKFYLVREDITSRIREALKNVGKNLDGQKSALQK